MAREEEKDPEPPEFKEISKEKIHQTVENINAKLKGGNGKTDSDKKAKAKLNYIKNNFENKSKSAHYYFNTWFRYKVL